MDAVKWIKIFLFARSAAIKILYFVLDVVPTKRYFEYWPSVFFTLIIDSVSVRGSFTLLALSYTHNVTWTAFFNSNQVHPEVWALPKLTKHLTSLFGEQMATEAWQGLDAAIVKTLLIVEFTLLSHFHSLSPTYRSVRICSQGHDKRALCICVFLTPKFKRTFSQPFNPFTPKSDQCQISSAASPVILHRTVWGIWLFIAYSDERWLYYQFSLPHQYISL